MTAVTRNTEYDVVAVGGGAAGGMAETTWLDATAQADLVRRGEVSPKELAEAAIARIEAVNPRLDAVIRTRFEAARLEADGDLPDGPFRGVPILYKDVACTVAGEPTAFGLGPLREMAWPATSYLAEQFRAAGFIPLGRTNTAELATSATTEPRSFPPARNPWDPGHSAGGSSGGSAAAVAAGLVPVAHATDGAGSIRIPASECGLVGLKPTRGRVSWGPLIAGQTGRGGDGTDDVAGHEQLQAEQDGLAQLLAETQVDRTLAPGEADGGDHERDRYAGHDDHDPRRIDDHPDLLDHVVETISLPVDLPVRLSGCAPGQPAHGRPGRKVRAGVSFHRPDR